MDTAQWPQVVGLMKSKEEIAPDTCSKTVLEKRVLPQDQALNCPRCSSTNTKFCYYNNYSLTQPRCLCKTCRRYWTEGGSLRNVPVGGGSRKDKRSTSSSSSTSFHKFPDHLNPPGLTQFSSQNPRTHEGQDYLNLAFPATHGVSQFVKLPKVEANNHNFSSSSPLSALEVLLKTGTASRGFNSFVPTLMPNSNALYTSLFPLPEFKPTSCLSADGLGSSRYGRVHGLEENGGRLMFPFWSTERVFKSN